ncbi:MAG: ISL3 family transposase [Caldimicrobium sp.]
MWNFNKILGISGWEIVKSQTTSQKIIFYLKQRRKTSNCPRCQRRTKHLYGYSRLRRIKNGTILGKFCELLIKPRRFKCLNCNLVFNEPLNIVGLYQRTTLKHKTELIFNLSNQSFHSAAKKYKISYHTQRRWLEQIIKEEVFNFDKEEKENKPFVLGIDEVSFAGRDMLTTIGNITKHRLKGVLKSKRKDELKKILKSLSPKVKSLIKEVVIDMSDLYKKTVEETLPNALIVADHFHVIQDANRRLEQTRLFLQEIYKKKIPKYILSKNKESLKEKEKGLLLMILNQYPELKMFYQTKERLRDMYKEKTKEKAKEKLNLIISTLTSSYDGELILWGRTLYYWKEPILNYWNSYSTNGFMEGMHNKMKLVKRISFGFKNKQVFIYKVMLSVLITTLYLQHILT